MLLHASKGVPIEAMLKIINRNKVENPFLASIDSSTSITLEIWESFWVNRDSNQKRRR